METETLNEDGTFQLTYEMDLEQETFELIQVSLLKHIVFFDILVNNIEQHGL